MSPRSLPVSTSIVSGRIKACANTQLCHMGSGDKLGFSLLQGKYFYHLSYLPSMQSVFLKRIIFNFCLMLKENKSIHRPWGITVNVLKKKYIKKIFLLKSTAKVEQWNYIKRQIGDAFVSLRGGMDFLKLQGRRRLCWTHK